MHSMPLVTQFCFKWRQTYCGGSNFFSFKLKSAHRMQMCFLWWNREGFLSQNYFDFMGIWGRGGGGSLGRQQGRDLSHHLLTPVPSQWAAQAGGQLRNPYMLRAIVKEPSLFEEHLNWTTLKNALHEDLNTDSLLVNLVVN